MCIECEEVLVTIDIINHVLETEACSVIIIKRQVSQWLISIGKEASEEILKYNCRQLHTRRNYFS